MGFWFVRCCHFSFLLYLFYRWGRVYKRKFCLYVCPSSLSFSKILFLSFPSLFFFSSSDQIFSLSQYLPPFTSLQARCFPSFLSLFFFHFPYYPTPNIFLLLLHLPYIFIHFLLLGEGSSLTRSFFHCFHC